MLADVPEKMKVVGLALPGKLEEWTAHVPTPGPQQVLIKVAASGINPVDYKIATGEVPLGMAPPCVLGCDLSGTVVALGSDVKDFKVGDEVMGMTGGLGAGPHGTLAEYAVAHDAMIAHKPKNFTMREAAAIPLVLITAWEGLVDRARVKSGDTVLVTGGTGGVGHIIIQIAVAFGAKVYGTGSPQKRDIVERYGATFVDYHHPEELERIVREETPMGRGFDIVYETFGGEWLDRALSFVAPHGYILEINGFSNTMLAPAALKGAVIAFPMTCIPFIFPSSGFEQYTGGMLRASLPLIAEGKIRPIVDEEHIYEFSESGVLKAYDDLRNYRNSGKLVINIP